jgi:high affinity choline transporter 7
LLEFPALIDLPWYDRENNIQYFPFRTISMLLSLATIIGVSLTADWAFTGRHIDPRYDFLHCIVNISEENRPLPKDSNASPTGYELNHMQAKDDLNGQVNPLLANADVESRRAEYASIKP